MAGTETAVNFRDAIRKYGEVFDFTTLAPRHEKLKPLSKDQMHKAQFAVAAEGDNVFVMVPVKPGGSKLTYHLKQEFGCTDVTRQSRDNEWEDVVINTKQKDINDIIKKIKAAVKPTLEQGKKDKIEFEKQETQRKELEKQKEQEAQRLKAEKQALAVELKDALSAYFTELKWEKALPSSGHFVEPGINERGLVLPMKANKNEFLSMSRMRNYLERHFGLEDVSEQSHGFDTVKDETYSYYPGSSFTFDPANPKLPAILEQIKAETKALKEQKEVPFDLEAFKKTLSALAYDQDIPVVKAKNLLLFSSKYGDKLYEIFSKAHINMLDTGAGPESHSFLMIDLTQKDMDKHIAQMNQNLLEENKEDAAHLGASFKEALMKLPPEDASKAVADMIESLRGVTPGTTQLSDANVRDGKVESPKRERK